MGSSVLYHTHLTQLFLGSQLSWGLGLRTLGWECPGGHSEPSCPASHQGCSLKESTRTHLFVYTLQYPFITPTPNSHCSAIRLVWREGKGGSGGVAEWAGGAQRGCAPGAPRALSEGPTLPPGTSWAPFKHPGGSCCPQNSPESTCFVPPVPFLVPKGPFLHHSLQMSLEGPDVNHP